MQLWDRVKDVCLRAEEEKDRAESLNQQFADLMMLIMESGLDIRECDKCGERRLYIDHPFGARQALKCAVCGDMHSMSFDTIKKEINVANNQSL